MNDDRLIELSQAQLQRRGSPATLSDFHQSASPLRVPQAASAAAVSQPEAESRLSELPGAASARLVH